MDDLDSENSSVRWTSSVVNCIKKDKRFPSQEDLNAEELPNGPPAMVSSLPAENVFCVDFSMRHSMNVGPPPGLVESGSYHMRPGSPPGLPGRDSQFSQHRGVGRGKRQAPPQNWQGEIHHTNAYNPSYPTNILLYESQLQHLPINSQYGVVSGVNLQYQPQHLEHNMPSHSEWPQNPLSGARTDVSAAATGSQSGNPFAHHSFQPPGFQLLPDHYGEISSNYQQPHAQSFVRRPEDKIDTSSEETLSTLEQNSCSNQPFSMATRRIRSNRFNNPSLSLQKPETSEQSQYSLSGRLSDSLGQKVGPAFDYQSSRQRVESTEVMSETTLLNSYSSHSKDTTLSDSSSHRLSNLHISIPPPSTTVTTLDRSDSIETPERTLNWAAEVVTPFECPDTPYGYSERPSEEPQGSQNHSLEYKKMTFGYQENFEQSLTDFQSEFPPLSRGFTKKHDDERVEKVSTKSNTLDRTSAEFLEDFPPLGVSIGGPQRAPSPVLSWRQRSSGGSDDSRGARRGSPHLKDDNFSESSIELPLPEDEDEDYADDNDNVSFEENFSDKAIRTSPNSRTNLRQQVFRRSNIPSLKGGVSDAPAPETKSTGKLSWRRGDKQLIQFRVGGSASAFPTNPSAGGTVDKDLYVSTDQLQYTRWKERMDELNAACGDETYIDSHCHIDFLVKRLNWSFSRDGNVTKFLNQFHNPSQFEGMVSIFCEPYAFTSFQTYSQIIGDDKFKIRGAFGIHPHSAEHYSDSIEESLKRALAHPKAVACGEIGLDYTQRSAAPPEQQRSVFARQIRLSVKMDKPICIHCRDAERDLHKVLDEALPSPNYLMHRHCFTEGVDEMNNLLDKFPNMYFGFTNLINLRGADLAIQAAKHVPLNRVLLETDAPYFIPPSCPKSVVKYANPAMALEVAGKLAELKDLPLKTVLSQIRKNTRRMYQI